MRVTPPSAAAAPTIAYKPKQKPEKKLCAISIACHCEVQTKGKGGWYRVQNLKRIIVQKIKNRPGVMQVSGSGQAFEIVGVVACILREKKKVRLQ